MRQDTHCLDDCAAGDDRVLDDLQGQPGKQQGGQHGTLLTAHCIMKRNHVLQACSMQ